MPPWLSLQIFLPSMSVEQRTSEIAAPLIKVVDENSPNTTRKRSFATIRKIIDLLYHRLRAEWGFLENCNFNGKTLNPNDLTIPLTKSIYVPVFLAETG